MKFILIFLTLIGMFSLALASEPQIMHMEHYQPYVELLPDDRIEYGDSFTIRAWLTTYEDKPENQGYFVDVLDSEHNQVDSTLWFARQDFVYEFDTTRPSYNITKGGTYIIQLERADEMQRTGNIDKTLEFEIIIPKKSSSKIDHSELYFQSKKWHQSNNLKDWSRNRHHFSILFSK